MKEREQWLDISKGIAIFLVVFGHVNLGFLQANMFKTQQPVMQYIHFTIYSFHMPLFFIISGYLYFKSWNINSFIDYRSNIIRKLINLGIPYLVFSYLQGFTKIIMSKSVNGEVTIKDLLLIPIKPIAQFWYIYVLLIIFIIIPLLDFKIKNKMIVLGILTIGLIWRWYFLTNIIALDYLLANAFYFYVGKLVSENIRIAINKLSLIISLLLYVVLNIISYKLIIPNLLIINMLSALTGSLVIICISRYIRSDLISSLGKMSFQVYLLHIIFGSGIRVVLTKVHINNIFIHYLAGVGLGIMLPILLYKAVSNIICLDFLFFPYKNLKKQKANLTI